MKAAMKENFDIYNTVFAGNVPPLGANNWVFNLPSSRNRRQIKSIFWDLVFFNTIPAAYIPLETINFLYYTLTLGNAVSQVANAFDVTTIPAGGTRDFFVMNIRKPGQYLFDSFFINDLLPIGIILGNTDPINTYHYLSTVTIESSIL